MEAAETPTPHNEGHALSKIALTTFGILALELALIRWTSGQVRVFAYFNNLILIGAFLGMGLGLGLGRRKPELVHWTLPMLFLLALPLGLSEPLGLMDLAFPDDSVFLWGGEKLLGNTLHAAWTLLLFLVLWVLHVAVFVCAGTPLGTWFGRAAPLRAYTADLGGSLIGIGVFSLLTFSNTSPPLWFALAGIPFLMLSRKATSVAALVGVVALAWFSVGEATYSPYNRIDLTERDGDRIRLAVNRDFHQYMRDLSDEKLARQDLSKEERDRAEGYRKLYDLPYILNPVRRSALIVGAGTGNDVMGAVRNNYERIVSVDIDEQIIALGTQLHPEKPYQDPRVEPVVNDARAYFEQTEGQTFDVISYGLLDSHAMFSKMSSLRLDNYVYTEEGIRSAYNHLSPEGHLVINFSVFAGQWMTDRLYWTITKATGQKPITAYHGLQHGAVFIVPREKADLDLSPISMYPQNLVRSPIDAVETTSDDWPFLYIQLNKVPWGYLIVLFVVLLLAWKWTPIAYGKEALASQFHPALFFMGAAFLLLETHAVTRLSLLFGSTWVVNSAVFAGILFMVLVANMLVDRFQWTNPMPWFLGLVLATLFIWGVDISNLNQMGILERGVIGGLLIGLPIFFAGVIVPMLLKSAQDPTSALGSNLLGSVVGGCLEYFSMIVGLKALVLLALALYLLALLQVQRAKEA